MCHLYRLRINTHVLTKDHVHSYRATCSKFPDFSLTGKCLPIFPGFPGFPVRVGTLYNSTPVRISAIDVLFLEVLPVCIGCILFWTSLTTQDQTKCGPEVFLLLKAETIVTHICRLLDIYRLNFCLKDAFRIFSRDLRSSPK